MRRLIVNADDFGRTPGVNAGTLEAHRRGIVTAATVMVLEAAAEEGIREAAAGAPKLDLGLHLVLTGGGRPASQASSVPTLAPGGRFVRNAEALPTRIDREEVRREIAAQLDRFSLLAGRPPSHLDSHHHAALHPDVEPVFAAVARERGLPARAASGAARERLRKSGVRTADVFLDGFHGDGATARNLRAILQTLPEGTSELMCHPGFPDAALRRGSTYSEERAREAEALCDPDLPRLLGRLGIALVGYTAL